MIHGQLSFDTWSASWKLQSSCRVLNVMRIATQNISQYGFAMHVEQLQGGESLSTRVMFCRLWLSDQQQLMTRLPFRSDRWNLVKFDKNTHTTHKRVKQPAFITEDHQLNWTTKTDKKKRQRYKDTTFELLSFFQSTEKINSSQHTHTQKETFGLNHHEDSIFYTKNIKWRNWNKTHLFFFFWWWW